MDQILELLKIDPIKAIALGAMAIVLYFLKKETSRQAKQFEKWESDAESFSSKIETAEDNFKIQADSIRSDAVLIKESIMKLRGQMSQDVADIKIHSTMLQNKSEIIKNSLELVVDKVDAKLLGVVEVREKADKALGKIINIEEENQKFKASIKAVGQIVAHHDELLKKDKK